MSGSKKPPIVARSLNARMLLMLLCPLVLATTGRAQGPIHGEINYPQLGLTFTIPEGWVAQENEGSVVIGSETIAGMILMSTHEMTTMAEMKAGMEEGLSEGGITLIPDGQAKEMRNDVLVSNYTGTAEGQAARGMAYGLLNSHGNGVIIIALTLENVWSDALKNVFSKIEYTGPSLEDWQKYLVNSRLTFRESYYSSSPIDGSSGGYRSKQQIDLCNGWFTTSGSSMVSAGSSGVSGHSAVSNQGEGNWKVIAGRNGAPMLVLEHGNGQRSEYQLEDKDGKLYLNSKRWFRTQQGEYAPACN